ncbi:hypothetical protein EHI8A_175460 [Entamoeba histolytica HM-1:IMSS-B]|uniref:Uncharacterized protein n=6 Tax=Entamoeba histolytica TaxID=5759 RepID=C4M487_ENTH1|nr:hypothetical protein, conserved [Entamoeba histolytica HM-1:IMSS]EMD47695.1 signal peptidase, putative [Entamoeba histolytica KU27]EMH77136.1 hypothetical protein EHI8A_175460 [Entamoeba histolytica HM-1:IMSS-B]EMS13838.1 signal peptide protein [Entamoeba histolytica HM-3:IMSS]ENY65646.1 signal peptide, putative [Entamoeba histolytica HM-1:IMSS-A]GAT96169.1 hypothetical protein conserved [Entamoeba histolytica]|eukprot:XP_653235.2 hypothetical protein, conserved [Entamoeba histolytica HM-1:IMSS]
MIILFLFIGLSVGVDFNINIRFSKEDENKFIKFAKNITQEASITNQIDFTKCAPHITLYLTKFQETSIPIVVEKIAEAVKDLRGCIINMDKPYASGKYFMFRATNTPCLQKLSDQITLFTSPFRDTNYTCPSWVDTLPEEEKNKKKKYCDSYGSPNVFEGFDPHVTLVYSDSEDLTKLEKYTYPKITLTSVKVSMTICGSYGTVIRGSEKIFSYLYEPLLTF